jgi:hypothetical protein
MIVAIAHFAGLVLTTIFAAAAAVLLDWLLLRAMFQLMRPAAAKHAQSGPLQSLGFARDKKAAPTTANHTTFGAELVQGTRELVRHLGPAAVRR